MNHEQFVSVINVLKGKTETDSHKLDIFLCRLTADVQLFLHNRFLTKKIQEWPLLQSSPINIADSCNTLLSGC